MDVARFGDWATLAYTNAKVRENYSRRFSHPLPQRGAAGRAAAADDAGLRPAAGARRAVWARPSGSRCRCGSRRRAPSRRTFSFRRSNDFEHVGDEVRAVRERVGLTEIVQLRQVRGDRARAPRLAGPTAHQPHAEARPHRR